MKDTSPSIHSDKTPQIPKTHLCLNTPNNSNPLLEQENNQAFVKTRLIVLKLEGTLADCEELIERSCLRRRLKAGVQPAQPQMFYVVDQMRSEKKIQTKETPQPGKDGTREGKGRTSEKFTGPLIKPFFLAG